MATRQAYGVALKKLGQASQRVVALDGDTKNSTFSETFKKAFPDRYIECFIAEQNMVNDPSVLRLIYVPFPHSWSVLTVLLTISQPIDPGTLSQLWETSTWFALQYYNLLQLGLICYCTFTHDNPSSLLLLICAQLTLRLDPYPTTSTVILN